MAPHHVLALVIAAAVAVPLLLVALGASAAEPAAAPSSPATPTGSTSVGAPASGEAGHRHHHGTADAAAWVDRLERADRAAWQKPDEVVAALALSGGETVFDVGAGSGYFTFRFARLLPRGRVVAVDVDPGLLRHLEGRVAEEKVANVTVRRGEAADPTVDATADLVFICDVLHHVDDREEWLRRLQGEMRPGARLAVVEHKEGPLPQGPPEAMKIPRVEQIRLLRAAGLELVSEDLRLLPYQTLQIWRRPAR